MMDNQWVDIAKSYGLETYEGYKKLFINHKHYFKDLSRQSQFYDGDTYVSMEKAIEAVRLTEKAIKEKYKIKDDAESQSN